MTHTEFWIDGDKLAAVTHLSHGAHESAARSAAWSALKPTLDELQASALALVDRMIEARDMADAS